MTQHCTICGPNFYGKCTHGTLIKNNSEEQRVIDAKTQKLNGSRAYSDSFNHVVINYGGTEFGYDLACAIQLRAELDVAIINAAKSNDKYA